MKAIYPLKTADPVNMVEPLVKYLELHDSPQAALSIRDSLNQINQLRNKAVSLELPNNADITIISKYIAILEMYVRYARLISKHFNWNPEYGPTVQDFNIVWHDSFSPQITFMKPEIHFDIFCVYYNLGVLYFYKAASLCMEDLHSARKQSITYAKKSQYFFNQMRTVFYPGFVNTGFSDTNYPHLELLECLSEGIIYKNMFELFKDDQYKHGINKVASLAVLAHDNFYKAYQIATQYFMKSSHISNNIKADLLSFAYVQSLYFDVIANSKSAKYYENQMDTNKDNISLLIAYQKKALRLLTLGLTNENVLHLLNQRPDQKKELQLIKPELENSLKKNLMRNKQIYKVPEIPEQKIPPPFEPPKQYVSKPTQPKQIALEYDSKNAAPFANLVDNESKGFINELKEFCTNRLNGLESAYSKLQKNIQTIYNDCFVNYYLNLEQNSQKKGIPENLKKKLQQIQSNGGKDKIQLEIKIIKKNAEQVNHFFQTIKQSLTGEQQFDQQKRSKYGNKWNRPPSNVAQQSYRNQINMYEGKSAQANQANQKIIAKYESLRKYIDVCGGNEHQVMSIMPQVQITQFIEQNKKDFTDLSHGASNIKQRMDQLDKITSQLKAFFTKMNFNEIAQANFKSGNQSKDQILEKIFAPAFKLIEGFNEKARDVETDAKHVGDISINLNKKNKGDDSAKKEFENIMNKFNEVNNLFREISQGTSFYTKLNDILSRIDADVDGFIQARKIQAQELQQSLNRGGGPGGPNLPNMYPNQAPQQNYGFYVPPPMHFDGPKNTQNTFDAKHSSLGDMLHNLMSSKPSFNTNLFSGEDKIYSSRYK